MVGLGLVLERVSVGVPVWGEFALIFASIVLMFLPVLVAYLVGLNLYALGLAVRG